MRDALVETLSPELQSAVMFRSKKKAAQVSTASRSSAQIFKAALIYFALVFGTDSCWERFACSGQVHASARETPNFLTKGMKTQLKSACK
jgi:hypothetical protein